MGRSVSLTDDSVAIAPAMEFSPRTIHLLENSDEDQKVTETENSDAEFHERVTKVTLSHFLDSYLKLLRELS